MMQKEEEIDLLAKFNRVKNQGYSAMLVQISFKAYSMISRMMDQNKHYQNVAYGLKVAEFLQLLNLVLNRDLAFMWQSSVLSYIMIVCQYLNWTKVRSQDQDTVLITVFFFNCLMVFVWLSLLLMFVFGKKELVTFRNGLLILVSGYTIVFNSLLILPMAQLSFNVTFCIATDVSTSMCSGRPWSLARILAILNLTLVCFKSWLFEFNLVDLNPLGNSVFSSYWHKSLLISQLRKVLLALFFASLGMVS